MSTRTSKARLLLLVVLTALAASALWLYLSPTRQPTRSIAVSEEHAHTSAASEVEQYTCSMHPGVHQLTAGKCPLCGMDLVQISKQQQRDGVVLIDDARRQLIGVKTESVVRGSALHTVRATGRVTYNESTLTDVSLKVSGWVTKLLVNTTGQPVTRGQTLFTFYSPELYGAQQDFLSARRSGRALTQGSKSVGHQHEPWTSAGRQRLHLLGMDDAQVNRLASREEPLDAVAVTAPASGFVIEKELVEGAAISAGMRLYRIAKLDTIWVEAELYESDFALARVGQEVKVTLDYVQGREYSAKIAYVYPYVDVATRTGRVRVELENKKLELRPGMYATVELSTRMEDRVLVPMSAVVYTGPRRLVFVDLGNGQFKPQEVRLGAQLSRSYEVLEGVRPGDVVATSATFLLAAEARISATTTYWDEPGHTLQPAVSGYICPMHPEVQSEGPSDCPKCGMKLEAAQPRGAQ